MVIHSDPLKTKDVVGKIREELFKKGINSNLAGVSTSPDDFFDEKILPEIGPDLGKEANLWSRALNKSFVKFRFKLV